MQDPVIFMWIIYLSIEGQNTQRKNLYAYITFFLSFFLKKDQLFIWKVRWLREVTEVLHLLVQSQNGHNKGAMFMPRATHFTWVSPVDGKGSGTWTIFCCFPVTLTGGWIKSGVIGTPTSTGSRLDHCATILPYIFFSLKNTNVLEVP